MSIPSAGRPFLATEPSFNDDLVKSFAKACGCSGKTIESAVACLRTTDVGVLVNQSIAWEGSQTGFGGFVQGNLFQKIRRREFPEVPIMVSTTRDEGTVLALGFQPNSTEETKRSVASEQMCSNQLKYSG